MSPLIFDTRVLHSRSRHWGMGDKEGGNGGGDGGPSAYHKGQELEDRGEGRDDHLG